MKQFGIALGVIGALAATSPVRAKVLTVDDGNVPCFNAPYHSINDALAVAEDGDEIQICPGLYREQVVLTKRLTLRGLPVGSQKVVIQPTALPASRKSVVGGKLVAAGILVDAPRVGLDSLVVDMSAANAVGCAPAVAGIYLRNASGLVNNVAELGAQAAAPADCDTGVGLLIEGSVAGDIFGQPVFGKAVVAIAGSEFNGNQKGGIVISGFRAIVKMTQTQVLGSLTTAAVQNGIQVSSEAKARLQEVQVRDLVANVSGKTATGILLYGAHKVRVRRSTLTNVETGVFVVGDRTRVLDTEIGDLLDDGIVLLGQKNRAFGNLIDTIASSSAAGVFIDGDHNIVRGGHMSDMHVGVWVYDGERNLDKGIEFTNVDERERVGGTRDLTAASVDPFELDCATVSDCDDGNACTVDACDATTGVCSYTNVPDLTSCSDGDACNGDETCVAGVCHLGTAPVCVDGNACTQNLCDPVLGCQFPPVPDLTSCSDGDACNGAEVCVTGVCQPGAPLVCNDGNACTQDLCDPLLGCQYPAVPDLTSCSDGDVCNGDEVCMTGVCQVGAPLACTDGNECTQDLCDPLLGCQFPPVPDGTPCNAGLGLCTAGICL